MKCAEWKDRLEKHFDKIGILKLPGFESWRTLLTGMLHPNPRKRWTIKKVYEHIESRLKLIGV